MRATVFEFRYRFWFICLVFFLGFACYRFDRVNVAGALAKWVFRGSDPGLNSRAARHVLQGLFFISALLLTAAAAIRTWAGAYLQTEVVHDARLRTEKLVADGPYRHLRNPLYFGNMLLAAGVALLASRTGAVIIVLGNLLIVLRLIGREEAALLQTQGGAYGAFLAAVPRLWPSLRPRLPASGLNPQWPQAFLGELHLWIFALAGFYFAARLNSHPYRALLPGFFLVYFVLWMGLRRMRRRNPPEPVGSPTPSPSPPQ
jgi:hypothetical protein